MEFDRNYGNDLPGHTAVKVPTWKECGENNELYSFMMVVPALVGIFFKIEKFLADNYLISSKNQTLSRLCICFLL